MRRLERRLGERGACDFKVMRADEPIPSRGWTRFSNWKSADGKAEETAHKGNALLRKSGVTPRQVGESPILDTLKYTTHRVLRRLAATKDRFTSGGSDAQT